MKIIFYTDPHLRETSSYPPYNRVQENGLTGILNNIILGFSFVREQIKKHEPDLVVNLGDSYHKDNYVSIRTIHAASVAFDYISSICKKMNIDHLILMGNHDLYASLEDGTRITSICSLESHGITIYENMTYDLEDFRIFLMPFTDSLEEGYQGILSGSQCNLIAAHMDFLGAVHHNNHPVEVGLDPNVAVPVICGHIHLHQETGSVTYPGSLLMDSFSRESLKDAGGVLIYDTDSGKKELVRNNMSKHFIKVKDLDKIRTLDPDCCILKIYSETPEEDVKDLLEGFQYVYVNLKDKDSSTKETYIRHEIEKPEVLLRSFIAEDRPEYLSLYDEVVNNVSVR